MNRTTFVGTWPLSGLSDRLYGYFEQSFDHRCFRINGSCWFGKFRDGGDVVRQDTSGGDVGEAACLRCLRRFCKCGECADVVEREVVEVVVVVVDGDDVVEREDGVPLLPRSQQHHPSLQQQEQLLLNKRPVQIDKLRSQAKS